VIAIIALLIGILLPALGAARKTARQVVCSSSLRQIAMSANAYALENEEALAGGGITSGYDCLNLDPADRTGGTPKEAFFNGVAIQAWDWMGPLAKQMGFNGPGRSDNNTGPGSGEDNVGRGLRMRWYQSLEFYACPENRYEALAWNGSATGNDPNFRPGRMLSYAMSTQFTSTTAPALGSPTSPKNMGGTGHWPNADRGAFRPYLSRVGSPAEKVAYFESARYSSRSAAPDFDVNLSANYGGGFGGVGIWQNDSKECDRYMAPGEEGAGLPGVLAGFNYDARLWAFRHGTNANYAGAKGETVSGYARGNLAFFDGHVENRTDAEAAEPRIWFPTGTRLRNGQGQFWRSTLRLYPGQSPSGGEVFNVP
jgi:prepilin-type processing-associated H-X9-DG protein